MKKAPPVRRQKIKATDMERGIIVKRALEAQQAEEAFVLAQNRSNEVFTIFCAAHDLPNGCKLIGTDRAGHIILDLPADEKPAADETSKASTQG